MPGATTRMYSVSLRKNSRSSVEKSAFLESTNEFCARAPEAINKIEKIRQRFFMFLPFSGKNQDFFIACAPENFQPPCLRLGNAGRAACDYLTLAVPAGTGPEGGSRLVAAAPIAVTVSDLIALTAILSEASDPALAQQRWQDYLEGPDPAVAPWRRHAEAKLSGLRRPRGEP